MREHYAEEIMTFVYVRVSLYQSECIIFIVV